LTKIEKDGAIIPGAQPDHQMPNKHHQATLDPKLSDPDKTPGSGMFDDGDEHHHAPSG